MGLIEEYGGNFRTFGSATKTYAEANVDIDKTDIKALGNGTGAEGHGDVKITSDAKSDIAPFNVNLVGIGFNVGIGDVKSYVDVDDSTITSAKDTTLSAEGTNAVKMSLIDFSAVPMGGLSLDFSWAQLTSDVAAKVGKEGDADKSGRCGYQREIHPLAGLECVELRANAGATRSVSGSLIRKRVRIWRARSTRRAMCRSKRRIRSLKTAASMRRIR